MRKPDDQFAAALLTRLSTALLLGVSWCVTQHSRDVLFCAEQPLTAWHILIVAGLSVQSAPVWPSGIA